jgi:hypothetical protein
LSIRGVSLEKKRDGLREEEGSKGEREKKKNQKELEVVKK